jgi:Spy/CpxP family protein refolding chaperone
MIQRMHGLWAVALLLSPIAAAAQSSAPAAPAPAVAPAAPAEDDMMMVLGELFGPGDELGLAGDGPLALGEAPEGPEGAPGMMAYDDDGPDGDGPPKHVHRMMIGGPHERGMRMRRGMALRFAALDLTDAQRDKLRDIHEAAARKSVQRRADMQLARMDLGKLMRSESPTTSAVNAQIDKITRLQADGMKAHFDTFMQARAVLTPEQQKKLRSGPGPMQMRMEHGGHGERGED